MGHRLAGIGPENAVAALRISKACHDLGLSAKPGPVVRPQDFVTRPGLSVRGPAGMLTGPVGPLACKPGPLICPTVR
jgi:hypothetical protein